MLELHERENLKSQHEETAVSKACSRPSQSLVYLVYLASIPKEKTIGINELRFGSLFLLSLSTTFNVSLLLFNVRVKFNFNLYRVALQLPSIFYNRAL